MAQARITCLSQVLPLTHCAAVGDAKCMADLRETLLYFAYGSKMLTRRLTARTPSAVVVGNSYVEGYRLTFDKVSTDGSRWDPEQSLCRLQIPEEV
jgi:hypothetical protein